MAILTWNSKIYGGPQQEGLGIAYNHKANTMYYIWYNGNSSTYMVRADKLTPLPLNIGNYTNIPSTHIYGMAYIGSIDKLIVASPNTLYIFKCNVDGTLSYEKSFGFTAYSGVNSIMALAGDYRYLYFNAPSTGTIIKVDAKSYIDNNGSITSAPILKSVTLSNNILSSNVNTTTIGVDNKYFYIPINWGTATESLNYYVINKETGVLLSTESSIGTSFTGMAISNDGLKGMHITAWTDHADIYDIVGAFSTVTVPPAIPPMTTPTIGTKNFNDEVNITWNSVPIPVQPDGTILDINKVFYDVLYTPDGTNYMIMGAGLDTLSLLCKIYAGGSSLSRFAVRAYVLYTGIKYYSDMSYTNTFKTNTSTNVILPSLVFDGKVSYYTNNRIIPTTGPWTIEFTFKTTQSNGYIMAIDNGTNHVLICQISSGRLNVIVDGSGNTTTMNVNDNKIHHVGIVQSGGVTSVYLDGSFQYSITRTVPSLSPAYMYLGTMGYDYTGKPIYNGILGLPRFWSTARTIDQLNQYRSVVVPDSEPGLIDYMLMDSLTGLMKMKKNSYIITTSNGGLNWILLFMALNDVIIPYPDYFQRKENLEYLRNKVNEFRANNGLNNSVWTDPVIVGGYTPIKAIHWNEVEGAILEVYNTIGQSISSSDVEKQLNNPIVSKDTRYPIKGLQQRIINISKGLKNN